MYSRIRWSVIVTLSLVACSADETEVRRGSSEDSIINGEDASDLPAVVMLVSDDRQVCTGTLIRPNWVLTAAHCDSATDVRIVETGDTIRIVERKAHPGWDPEGETVFDYALLRLERQVTSIDPMPIDRDQLVTDVLDALALPIHHAEDRSRPKESFENCEFCGGRRRSLPASVAPTGDGGFVVAHVFGDEWPRSVAFQRLETDGTVSPDPTPSLSLAALGEAIPGDITVHQAPDGTLWLGALSFRQTGLNAFNEEVYQWQIFSWRLSDAQWVAVDPVEVETPQDAAELLFRSSTTGETVLAYDGAAGYVVFAFNGASAWTTLRDSLGFLHDVLANDDSTWTFLSHEYGEGNVGPPELTVWRTGPDGDEVLARTRSRSASVEAENTLGDLTREDGELVVTTLGTNAPCADDPVYQIRVRTLSSFTSNTSVYETELPVETRFTCVDSEDLEIQLLQFDADGAEVAVAHGRRRVLRRNLVRNVFLDSVVTRVTLSDANPEFEAFSADALMTSSGVEPVLEGMAKNRQGELALVWVADEIAMRSESPATASPFVERLYASVWGSAEMLPAYEQGEARFTVVGFGQDEEGTPGLQRPRAKAQLEPVAIDAGWVYVREVDQAACFGDSGGPLLVTAPDGEQRVGGVASFVVAKSSALDSNNCVGMTAYARVGPVLDWLDGAIDLRSNCSLTCECAQGCSEDGVCDPTMCDALSCAETVDCENTCWGLLFDDTERGLCIERCRSSSVANANGREFLVCANNALQEMAEQFEEPARTLDNHAVLRECRAEARNCLDTDGCDVLECLRICDRAGEFGCLEECDLAGVHTTDGAPLARALACAQSSQCGNLRGRYDRECIWEYCFREVSMLGQCSELYMSPPAAVVASADDTPVEGDIPTRGGCAGLAPSFLVIFMMRRRRRKPG
ncbi:MAG: trypsin-like serine protease [Myxococcota bacterium]